MYDDFDDSFGFPPLLHGTAFCAQYMPADSDRGWTVDDKSLDTYIPDTLVRIQARQICMTTAFTTILIPPSRHWVRLTYLYPDRLSSAAIPTGAFVTAVHVQ